MGKKTLESVEGNEWSTRSDVATAEVSKIGDEFLSEGRYLCGVLGLDGDDAIREHYGAALVEEGDLVHGDATDSG